MPLHDCAVLYSLRQEPDAHRTKFKEQLEVVTDESDFILQVVLAFLADRTVSRYNCVLMTRCFVSEHGNDVTNSCECTEMTCVGDMFNFHLVRCVCVLSLIHI